MRLPWVEYVFYLFLKLVALSLFAIYNFGMDSDSRKRNKQTLRTRHEVERQKSRGLLKKRLGAEDGWLLRIVERVDYVSFEKLSLLNWLTSWKPQWYGSMAVVETYVVSWLSVELILFALFAVFPNLADLTVLVVLALVLLVYRWHNIIAYWFHMHILTGKVSSPVRTLILTLINFTEIIVIFSILDFILAAAFNPAFVSIPNSLDYSIRIMTTLGWDKYEPVGFGYLLFYVRFFPE